MASILTIGVGVAAAAFIVFLPFPSLLKASLTLSQGRAGLVALRRSRGEAVGALGKAFYKGGFEPKMNKREAALILQLGYYPRHFLLSSWSCRG